MKKKRKVTPKRVIAVALGALFGYLIVDYFGIFLQERPSETDSYRMDATFTYLGSAENLPIENVWIVFPCPHVDTEIEIDISKFRDMWSLYWHDENGTLHLQASATENYKFHPPRTPPPQVIERVARYLQQRGPKFSFKLDKLYAREVFWVTVLVENLEGTVTLRDCDDNEGRSSGIFGKFSLTDPPSLDPLDFPMDVSFWAQLLKKVDNYYEPIETFSRFAENRTGADLWLYPS